MYYGQLVLPVNIDKYNNMISTTRYIKIHNNLSEFDLPEIIPYIPTPTDSDYKKGYIKRYFIQKSNDSDSYIFEINSDGFTQYSINPYFKVVSILWKISGNEISGANGKSIKIGNKTIPALHKYLQDTLQFSKQ
jgi:hypothetical protein